ncbi:hypothetical protein CTAYLR_003838 [Chrysophaeum taylorii]|uniref:Srp40 C-terminal domain-containing protein n=1 Tax=Chrysophaeum taylorii TaxID=2483200 RepID=A0AAD7UDN8_9STRA|nr:hypothetical protein CTAYLR_003838 [Chrysophaeum taylorii]
MRPSEALAAVHEFLTDCGLAKAAKALAKEAGSVEGPKVPLLEALEFWKAQQQEQEQESAEEAKPSTKKRKREEDVSEKKKKKNKNKKKEEAKRRADAKAAADAWVPKEIAKVEDESEKKPFRRVGDEWTQNLSDELRDNSFKGGYGAKASEKLIQVRGKDFRHGKTKLKRGSYRGGTIDLGSNSVKFED